MCAGVLFLTHTHTHTHTFPPWFRYLSVSACSACLGRTQPSLAEATAVLMRRLWGTTIRRTHGRYTSTVCYAPFILPVCCMLWYEQHHPTSRSNPLPPHCPSICMHQPGRLHALAHDMTMRLRIDEQCDIVVCLLHGGTDFAGGDEVNTFTCTCSVALKGAMRYIR